MQHFHRGIVVLIILLGLSNLADSQLCSLFQNVPSFKTSVSQINKLAVTYSSYTASNVFVSWLPLGGSGTTVEYSVRISGGTQEDLDHILLEFTNKTSDGSVILNLDLLGSDGRISKSVTATPSMCLVLLSWIVAVFAPRGREGQLDSRFFAVTTAVVIGVLAVGVAAYEPSCIYIEVKVLYPTNSGITQLCTNNACTSVNGGSTTGGSGTTGSTTGSTTSGTTGPLPSVTPSQFASPSSSPNLLSGSPSPSPVSNPSASSSPLSNPSASSSPNPNVFPPSSSSPGASPVAGSASPSPSPGAVINFSPDPSQSPSPSADPYWSPSATPSGSPSAPPSSSISSTPSPSPVSPSATPSTSSSPSMSPSSSTTTPSLTPSPSASPTARPLIVVYSASASQCDNGLSGTVSFFGDNLFYLNGVYLNQSGTWISIYSEIGTQQQADAYYTFPGSGTYNFKLTGVSGESVFIDTFVEIFSQLYILSADPQIIWNGIPVQLTIYVAGLTSPIKTLNLIGPSGQTLTYTSANATQDPANYPKVQVVVPTGVQPGVWAASLTGSCTGPATIDGLFNVTSTLSLTISSIDPPFVYRGIANGIGIYGAGFVGTPKVYMYPSNAGSGATALSLRAVVYVDGGRLQAVIPAGLTTGDYDIVVVNPTGTIGSRSRAVRVTANPPPFVQAMVPGYLNTNQPQAVTLNGNYFDSTNITISIFCKLYNDYTVQNNITGPNPNIIISSKNATVIQATLPGNLLGDDKVCVVRVINGDGAYFDYQAVGTRNPANKMKYWYAFNATLNRPRRGLQTQSVAVTTSSKYIFAIGGDNGTLASAYDTVESSQMDKYGDLQGFFIQRYTLPRKLTFGSLVKIGRFLYHVGGYDPSRNGPTNEVFRAEVLDPLKTPTLNADVLAVTSGSKKRAGGFPPGTYYYCVSSLFAANDVNNPGGESLTGEILTMYVPVATGSAVIHIKLTWNEIPDAIGYKVYRSPYANAPVSQLQLLATVTGSSNLTFTDKGYSTVSGSTPLPIGSTGVWHWVANMTTARWGHATTQSPSHTVANNWFITAYTGATTASPTASLSSSYEAIRVIVFPSNDSTLVREKQTVTGSFTLLTKAGAIPDPRFLGSASRVGPEDLTGLSALDSAIIMGPGLTSSGNLGNKMWLAATTDQGDTADFLQPFWQNDTDPPTSTFGYCLFQGFGLVHAIGGMTASAGFPGSLSFTSNGRILTNPGLRQDPTQLWGSNWSGSLARAYGGCGRENALFFYVGGTITDASIPSITVLRVPQ